MIEGCAPLERARFVWKILAFTGVIILLLVSIISWASVHFPILIYLLIAISFADLGVLGYFVFNIGIHYRMTHQTREKESKSSGTVRVAAISLLISAGAEVIYVAVTNNWNEYALIILFGILFSLLLVPFHYMYDETRRSRGGH